LLFKLAVVRKNFWRFSSSVDPALHLTSMQTLFSFYLNFSGHVFRLAVDSSIGAPVAGAAFDMCRGEHPFCSQEPVVKHVNDYNNEAHEGELNRLPSMDNEVEEFDRVVVISSATSKGVYEGVRYESLGETWFVDREAFL
jgi:hypothetical protein